jgi:REP element-mobilizing transposase RayT
MLHDIEILAGTVRPDHVHLLLSVPPHLVRSRVMRKILSHLGLLTDVPPPRPPSADLFGWS